VNSGRPFSFLWKAGRGSFSDVVYGVVATLGNRYKVGLQSIISGLVPEKLVQTRRPQVTREVNR